MLNTETAEYGGDSVIMPNMLYDELRKYVEEPLLRISESHYWTQPQSAVPSKTIAIPSDVEFRSNSPVLMAKDETAFTLVDAGEKARPT